MHTQVLDDSRPVVMVMKRLGLGSVWSGVEWYALAGSETPSSVHSPIGTCCSQVVTNYSIQGLHPIQLSGQAGSRGQRVRLAEPLLNETVK